jgi:hypothetical protein
MADDLRHLDFVESRKQLSRGPGQASRSIRARYAFFGFSMTPTRADQNAVPLDTAIGPVIAEQGALLLAGIRQMIVGLGE